MKKVMQEVKRYYLASNQNVTFDADTLADACSVLSNEEAKVITKSYIPGDRPSPEYLLYVNRVYNRYRDIQNGATSVRRGKLTCTESSAVTELELPIDVIRMLNRHKIFAVKDLSKLSSFRDNPTVREQIVTALNEYNSKFGVNVVC